MEACPLGNDLRPSLTRRASWFGAHLGMPGASHAVSAPSGQHRARKSGRNAPTAFFSALVTANPSVTASSRPTMARLVSARDRATESVRARDAARMMLTGMITPRNGSVQVGNVCSPR